MPASMLSLCLDRVMPLTVVGLELAPAGSVELGRGLQLATTDLLKECLQARSEESRLYI